YLFLDVGGGRNLGLADRENDVTGLQPALGRLAVRVDVGDGDTGLVVGRTKRQAEIVERRRLGLLLAAVILVRSLLVAGRELAELDVDILLRAVAPVGDLDVGARRETGDPHGKVARILNRLPVHRDDRIARLQACGDGRAVVLRFGDERALVVLEL